MSTKAIQSETQKIPELRFLGFSGVWEEKKLGEVAKFWNGKAHEQDISANGKYIVINSKFISQNGDIKKYSDKQASPLKKDDIAIVMSDIPNGKAMGKCFLVDKDEKYTLNQRIGGIKSKEIISPFLIRILNRNKYFLKFDNGVSQTNLRKDEVLRCPVIFPSILEQQKIVGFLGAVDEWIENLRAQKESFELYKKSLTQKIFSQQIRFKDANGNNFPSWENKKLGEVCKITTGKLDANAMKENGEYRFYTCAKEYYQIDKYAFDTEALLVSGNGANVGYIHYYKGKFNAYQRTYVLDNFKSDIIFTKYFLDTKLSIRILKEKKAGNTPYIVLDTLKEMIIKLPPLLEQQKIAGFLTSVDNLIESKQQQITQSQQWKKGLMQCLFV